jgi:hypothetical protein
MVENRFELKDRPVLFCGDRRLSVRYEALHAAPAHVFRNFDTHLMRADCDQFVQGAAPSALVGQIDGVKNEAPRLTV